MGQTLTCEAPAFGGSPSTLRFRWIFNGRLVSTRQTVIAAPAMAGHSVGCNVTARNASSHFDLSTPRIGRLTIQR